MKKIIRLISVMLTAVILLTVLCIPASAASIEDTAKAIDSGKKISFTPKSNSLWGGPYYDYKVTLSEKGTLKLTFNTQAEKIFVTVLNSDGKWLKLSDKNASSGSIYQSSFDGETWLSWNRNVEKFNGTLSYKSLAKGTYYVRIWTASNYDVKGKMSVSFSYPQEKAESEETEGKISYLSVTLKKGSTLQLGAVVDGEGTVKWSTSKKAVATVTSKGKITAKSAGTATITAKLGSSSVKIRIKITE